MEYLTLVARNTRELDIQVTLKLSKGWKLYGSPHAGAYGHVQVMTLGDYRNKPKKK